MIELMIDNEDDSVDGVDDNSDNDIDVNLTLLNGKIYSICVSEKTNSASQIIYNKTEEGPQKPTKMYLR